MTDIAPAPRPRSGEPAARRRRRAAGPGTKMGLLGDMIGYHLRCAHAAYFQDFNAAFGAHDISGPQFGTLLLIEANPGLTQSAVAEALRFDRSTLVQIIDRLEARALVRRGASATDRRSYALELTRDGEALIDVLKSLATRHEDAFGAGLSQSERRNLVRLLGRLHEDHAARKRGR